MRDIILYYYDHSDEMEFLNDIQEKIARKNKTTETKVRDALNSATLEKSKHLVFQATLLN